MVLPKMSLMALNPPCGPHSQPTGLTLSPENERQRYLRLFKSPHPLGLVGVYHQDPNKKCVLLNTAAQYKSERVPVCLILGLEFDLKNSQT